MQRFRKCQVLESVKDANGALLLDAAGELKEPDVPSRRPPLTPVACGPVDVPSEGIQNTNSKRLTHSPVFTAALFTVTKIQKQPRYSSLDERTNKIWYI